MSTVDVQSVAPTLLLVDDDETFRTVTAAALTRRGYAVTTAASAEEATALALHRPTELAVVDLKMPGSSGLALIKALLALNPQTNIVMLTGYASIATAVEAIKLGARHYLTKPVDADQVVAALSRGGGDPSVAVAHAPPSVKRREWEHIQQVLAENNGNIAATARSLMMHRRTLQRKLSKHPTRK